MIDKGMLLAAALLACGGALGQGQVTQAQPTIGAATDVKGLVTVSDGSTIANVVKDARLPKGSRLVTSSTGFITVKTDEGCEISLKPNESLRLEADRSCKALLAMIESLGGGGELSGPALALLLLSGTALMSGSGTGPSGGNLGNGAGGSLPVISNQ